MLHINIFCWYSNALILFLFCKNYLLGSRNLSWQLFSFNTFIISLYCLLAYIVLRSYCQSNYFYFQGNLPFFCSCFLKNKKFLKYNLDTIKHTHFKCTFWWVLTNLFSWPISTTSKMYSVAMTMKVLPIPCPCS